LPAAAGANANLSGKARPTKDFFICLLTALIKAASKHGTPFDLFAQSLYRERWQVVAKF